MVADLPHRAIRRGLALLPVLLTGTLLLWQTALLMAPPGRRDAQGLVKGHDFAHFYTLGAIARTGPLSALYDTRALSETMWRLLPETRPGVFLPLYGPQVAMACAPLAALDYEHAVQVWLTTTVSLYAAAAVGIVLLLPTSPVPRSVLVLSHALNPALARYSRRGKRASLRSGP